MLVLMDESGDTGFKIRSGSSSHFVIMLILIRDNGQAELANTYIQDVRRERGWSKEFHFVHTFDKIRIAFLSKMAKIKLSYRVIVSDKNVIYSEFLKADGDGFYNYLTRMILEHDNGSIVDATLFLDKRGDKGWRNAFAIYLRKTVNKNPDGAPKVKEIKLKDWEENSLVQIADMYSGAVFRLVTEGGAVQICGGTSLQY